MDLNDVAKGLAIINSLDQQQRQQQVQQPQTATQPQTSASPQPAANRQTVREVQSALTGLGYDPGPVDGLMGRRTADAIRQFQADSGLSVTGVPSTELLEQLRATGPSGSQSRTAEAAVKPSFDCARAATPAEIAICNDDTLAAHDAAIADFYALASDRMEPAAAADLLTEQRAWLSRRNACGGNVACLEQSMRERAQELDRIATAAMGAPASGGVADAAEVATAQGDRPRFFLSNHFAPREDASRLEALRGRIATRLEYAANPSAIEDDAFLLRLLDTLPDDRIDELIGRIYPAGMPDIVANNIRAARRAHGPVLMQISGMLNEFDRELLLHEGRAMVERELPADQVPNPMPVDLVCSVSFGAYDFDTKAFEMIASSCREGRLDVTGASYLTEFRNGPSAGPIKMEVSEARAFADRFNGLRQALVSTPAELSVDASGSYLKLLITETGAPVLHPMQTLDEVLYRYPAAEGTASGAASDEAPGTPEVVAATEDLKRVPAVFFALRAAPDLLSEEDWLQLTERQIEYDQNRNGVSIFPREKVLDRRPSFAAPELVGEYKEAVTALLAEIDPSAIIRMEVLPQWVGYREGKLTSSEPWGYLRELYQDDRQRAMAFELGKAAVVADPGILGRLDVRQLPGSLASLPMLVKNVQITMDRLPRIPEIEMEPAAAEELFAVSCRREKLALDEASRRQADGEASAPEVARAYDAWGECANRASSLPDNFVFDLSVEFTGARRAGQGIFLETTLNGAELYDLRGRNFATLETAAFPMPTQEADTQASEPAPTAEPVTMQAPASAPARLAHADILGLKLGMPMGEAEEIARSHFPDLAAVLRRDGLESSTELFRDSLHFAGGSGEVIALYYLDERPEAGAVAITRSLDLPGEAPLASEYQKLISDKYALTDSDWSSGQARVHDGSDDVCIPYFPMNLGRGSPPDTSETWVEGSPSDVDALQFSKILSVTVPQMEEVRERLLSADCGPALVIRLQSNNNDLAILSVLVDQSAPAAVARQALSEAAGKIKTKF